MDRSTAHYTSPLDRFSYAALPKVAAEVFLSPQLALQQLKGWSRLFEETLENHKSTRSPLWWNGDSPLEALQTWCIEQEFSTLRLKDDNGYSLGLHTYIELLQWSGLRMTAQFENCSIKDLILRDKELAIDTPTSVIEIIRQTEKMIQEKTGIVYDPKKPDLVVYSAPRFFPRRARDKIEDLIGRVVIDPREKIPQNGVGYKFTNEMIEEMCHGFSSKLITLEFNNKIHGIYFLHLSFPEEPVCFSMAAAKIRASEMNLIDETLWSWGLSSKSISFEDINLAGKAQNNSKFAWADLVAISDEARQHFRQEGVHVYSSVHATMKELCALHGVGRLLGLVRIGSNENLAWHSHQRLGWQMPHEEYQRKNPLSSHGNDYALIYLDFK